MTSSRTCDGVRDLIVDTLVHQMVVGYGYGYTYGYGGGYPQAVPGAAPTVDASSSMTRSAAPSPAPAAGRAAPPPTQQTGPSHYTKTNIQEKGVDEADLVKTDGRFIYTLHNNQLVIAKTWPVDKTDVAARVTFKTIVPQQIYLRGNDVVLQGISVDPKTGYGYGKTRLMVVDVKDRAAPRIRRMIDIDGATLSSRLVGDDVYLAQQSNIMIPQRLNELAQKTAAKTPRGDQQSLRPWEVQARLAMTLRKTIHAAIRQSDIDAALPKVTTNGKTTAMTCADLYIPPSNIQLGMTTVARLSLGDGDAALVGAMVAGGQVYASTQALYVASPFYTWTNQGYPEYGTQVHKFGIAGEKPGYIASGRVEGSVLNQFSMSEHNGDLRIATTDWNWNGSQGGNNLLVLRPVGRQLQTIGAIRGIAKGERIFSGRMFGEKGYLVTFRQTDPLFTLDLSDPRKPRVAGELKINGYSSYIHPMGNDLLLTIGQDATDQGRVTGMHLQVFDVSDPAKPVRRFHEKVATNSSYAWSAAEHDHHAFMYDPVTGTLALPLMESGGKDQFNGMIVYRLDRKRGFRKGGRIDHRALADGWIDQQCEDARRTKNGNEPYFCGKQNRTALRAQNPISRSMIVDKYVLSLSNLGLEIHELGDLDLAAKLSWVRVDKHRASIAQ